MIGSFIYESPTEKFAAAEAAAARIDSGMTLATSGFAAAGYPKAVLHALANRARMEAGFRLNFIGSSNLGTEIESEWAETGLPKRLTPFQMTPKCASAINKGFIEYAEMPLSRVAASVRNGSLGKIDVAVIEALRITKDHELVLTSGVGLSPLFVDQAEKIIVEVNTTQPEELEGMHDIYRPEIGPDKAPIPLRSVGGRIGERVLSIDPKKLLAVVVTNDRGVDVKYAPADELVGKFADNLFNFLELEIKRNPQWRGKLPPFQSGIGNIANNLVKAFERTTFRDIEFFCGLLQEANVELLASGKAKWASGSAVHVTEKVRALFKSDTEGYRERITLRPIDVINCAEIVDRMQLVAMNSAVEIDVYGNANLSHVMGNRVINGTGGGTTFAHNAGLSLMLLPSTGKGGDISTIVPKVTVQDIGTHYIDIVITDAGVADLRGKTPMERAEAIIQNCVSPIYREALAHYLRESAEKVGGHEPQLLDRCFEWHRRFRETGSMRPQ
jgi:succinyl-CoA:acetate CoA-transferase